MYPYKFTSANLRGLNNYTKAKIKLTKLASINSTFYFFQETKLAKRSTFNWSYFFKDYSIFENRAVSSVMGLAILIKTSVLINCKITQNNVNNRILTLHIEERGGDFDLKILNIHAPILAFYRLMFFQKLAKIILNLDNFVIMGDFNVNNPNKQSALERFIVKNNCVDLMFDISRKLIITRMDKQSANPLDRIIISKNIGGWFEYSTMCIPFSDHFAIVLKWFFPEDKKKIILLKNLFLI